MRRVFLFATLFVLFPLQALAQTAAATPMQQQWWQGALLYLVTVLGGIAAPVISYLVIVLLKKKNIAVEAALVDGLIEKAINYGEEQAAKALKANSPTTSGAQKMQLAIGAADTIADQLGLKKLAVDKLKTLIEAKLGAGRPASIAPVVVTPPSPTV